jgi:hypothetical protein
VTILDLGGRPRAEYGADYDAHVLEQYKLYVGMADEISKRRHEANNYFLAINTGAIALLGVAKEGEPSPVWYVVVSFAGIVLCVVWRAILKSYRDLNTAKFNVIHEIESQLPLRPYDAEWTAVGRGTDQERYRPLSHIERAVPWVFGALYLALICLALGGGLPGQNPTP